MSNKKPNRAARRAATSAAKRKSNKPVECAPVAGRELWLLPEVRFVTRLSVTSIWRLEKLRRFPQRLRISSKRVAWKASEIEAWLTARALEASTRRAA